MERLGRCWLTGVVVVALCAGLVLAACNRKQPLRIGFFATLSGRGADLGIAGRNGAMLAIEQANAAGGVQGRTLDLLVRDATPDNEVARQVFSDLLRQEVVAVLGPMTSVNAMLVVPQADAAQIPLLSPTATTTDLTGLDDFFFRVISDVTTYAVRNAHFHAQRLGYRRAAVIYDTANRSYSESWFGAFRTEFANWGGQMVAERTFSTEAEGAFSPLVEELLAAKPDFILVIANAVDAAQICQQIRKAAPKMAIAMAEWGSTERFIELAGSAAEEVVLAQFLNREDDSPVFQAFLQAYRQRFGQEPGFAGLAGYDAALMLLKALEQQRPGQALKATLLAAGPYQGVQQSFRFDRFGDSDRATYLSVIRQGRYLTLE